MTRATFNNKLREVMRNAWFLIRNYGMTLSDALRQAWRIFKVKKAMHEGIAKFKFKKLDGTIRSAVGTLTDEVTRTLIGGQYFNPSPKVVPYYDCEKQGWRSFRKELLIGMD